MSDRFASSPHRGSVSAAHCRRVAGRVVAAAVERAGFVVVTAAPRDARRALLQAIAEAAAAAFQVIEIGRGGGSEVGGPAGGAAPLFVIDDAAQPSSRGLREICQSAPLSPEWATMLSVRAVLITRFGMAELAFLQPRVVAVIPFAAPVLRREAPAARSLRAAPALPRPHMPAGGGSGDAAPRPPAQPQRRDVRPYALIAHLAIVAILAGCYLALQADRLPADLPSAALAAAAPAAGDSTPAANDERAVAASPHTLMPQ